MASRSIKNRPSAKKKQPKIGLLVVVAVFSTVVISTFVGVWALGTSWLQDLPDYDDMDSLNVSMPSEVRTEDGTVLAKFQLENRDPVELSEISPYVLQGTIATEDERFYDHGGFDLMGIARALVVNITGSGREGASTITQQLVRNTILVDEMEDISLKRKVREMYLSVKLEERYSKNDILLMYLNTINYGNSTYGIQAAAQRYFSKDAANLTLAEAAALVGIPQSPSYNNPLVDDGQNCLERRNLVLDRMLSNGYITQEEHDAAQAEPLALNESLPAEEGIYQYPHFVRYVKSLLTDPDGPYRYSSKEVGGGGLTIVTTLDPAVQEQAEAAVAAKLEKIHGETGSDAIQGALVCIEPSTGNIKAMVGGNSQVNLATGEGTDPDHPGRPSGSSFKTFTLIAALEAGISPDTLIDCSSPASIPNTGYGTTAPALQNIDNYNYGTRSIARAFEVSSNTGFVRLEMAVGMEKVAEVAQRMGITSPLSITPSMTLGSNNVTMLDMATAYAAIANQGVRNDPNPILTITKADGEVLVDNTAEEGSELRRTASEQVISPEVAHAAIEVMKTVVTGAQGTGYDARLSSGQTVAAKTGTSESYLDITFCGITPQLSTSIWFGDPSNQVTLPNHESAGDVFSSFMSQALALAPLEEFADAEDPPYQDFSNADYHVGGYGGYGRGGSSGSYGYSNGGYGYGYGYGGGGYGGSGDGGSSTTDPGGGASDGPSTGDGGSGGDTGDGGSPGGDTGGSGGDGGDGGSTGGGSDGGSTGGGSDGGSTGGDPGGSTGGGAAPAAVGFDQLVRQHLWLGRAVRAA
ncbi:glycosyl transferase [Gordonibacter sp. An230]|uniref:transglycosylase domain-containing protein n=1 Tax=Gordonibacter sp. An230 TaxID=1965592 RepID=UPI000B383F74|nr:transglycosylase domain-containing protein [Gordonibacter sp. An230]OUO87126.1 glycosyl transferase [Gordonibacter sp. An230]